MLRLLGFLGTYEVNYEYHNLSFLIVEHQLMKLICKKPYTSCNAFSSVMPLN